MSPKTEKLRKPSLAGLHDKSVKFNLAATLGVTVGGVFLFWIVYVRRRQHAYAEYYRTLDCEKQFREMQEARVFQSA